MACEAGDSMRKTSMPRRYGEATHMISFNLPLPVAS